MKDVTSKSVAFSCSSQDLVEKNLAYVVDTQQAMVVKHNDMDEKVRSIDVRQDIMGAYLIAILDLLKKPQS